MAPYLTRRLNTAGIYYYYNYFFEGGGPLCFLIMMWFRPQIPYTEPQQRHNHFEHFTLHHYLSATIAPAQHLSSHRCGGGAHLWRLGGEWGISLELRPRKQWEGPFRVGSDGRGTTWRGHAWLASPWQQSVFARWSIEEPCRPFCHGLCRHCFPRCRALAIYRPWLAWSLAPRLSR